MSNLEKENSMQPAHEKPDPNADSPEAIERRRSFNERMRDLIPLREPELFAAPLLRPNAS